MSVKVRPQLAGLLLAVLLVSGWALWVPEKPLAIIEATVQATGERAGDGFLPPSVPRPHQDGRAPSTDHHVTAERSEFEPALRDPFSAEPREVEAPRSRSTVVAGPAIPVTPIQPSLQPASVAPPVPRYLGQFLTPQGEWLVLLLDGATTTAAQPGTRLPSGWQVAALEPGRVQLVIPESSSSATVELPSRPGLNP